MYAFHGSAIGFRGKLLNMSSSSSRTSLFSIAPYSLSNNSYFSIDEYDYKRHSKGSHQQQKIDAPSSSNSIFSIDPVDGPHDSASQHSGKYVSFEPDETSIDDTSVTSSISLRFKQNMLCKSLSFNIWKVKIKCNMTKISIS